MYNLKKVFGVISFENKHIKIVVVDAANNELHCLYFKKIVYPGCNNNGKLNNFDDTRLILTNELINADKFIGIKIKRYILNISNLPISMTNQTIDNQGFKNKKDVYEYIDEHPYYPSAICIKKQIIGYITNDELVNELPNHSKFAVKCVNCFVNKNIIDEYENLFASLLINKIDIYVNAFTFKNAFETNGNSLLIDINEEHCNLVEYNKNNEIIYIQTTDFGTNWLKSKLIEQLKFDNDSKIESLVHNIKYLDYCSNNPVIANYFQDKYLKTKQLRLEDFKKICLLNVTKQINNLDSYLVDKFFDEIKINCNNWFNEIYSLASELNYLKIKNTKIEMSNESIIGLEDEYISNLFYVLEDVNKRYELNKNIRLISIDPFFSEDMSRNQFHKNMIIKLGIQSTKMWAKLGDGD